VIFFIYFVMNPNIRKQSNTSVMDKVTYISIVKVSGLM